MSKRPKKEDKLKPVYLIMGSDTPKVEMALRRLRDRVVADSGTDINVDMFSALDHHSGQVISAASTLPFGEGVRLVVVMDAGAWHKPDKDAMAAFLADAPEYSCVALVGGGIRKNEGLYRAVQAAGQVLEFEAPRPANFPRWAQEQAALRNLKLGSREASRLVALTGSD